MPAYTINRCTKCGILTTGISACHECGGETQIEPVSQGVVTFSRTITETATANTLVPCNATESECRALFKHIAEVDCIDNVTVLSESESFVVSEVISGTYFTEIRNIDQARMFLHQLHRDGRAYHLDDSPFEVFSAGLAKMIDARVAEIFEGKFDWGQFESPLGYLLDLD